LKAKVGDILKIERKHPTGKSFFYRRVVEWSLEWR
jgi:DNA-directed RNA polymerase subunit H (RpoH/RPB5)